MKQINGTIRNIDLDQRFFQIEYRHHIYYFYLTRSQIKSFERYLHVGLFVSLQYKEENTKLIGNIKAHEIVCFLKLQEVHRKNRLIYFDIKNSKKTISNILNKDTNRMFIDLEFSMPPYQYTKKFVSEIIEYGIVIESSSGEVLYSNKAYINPLNKNNITDRTLDFLGITKDKFKDAIEPIEFYTLLKSLMEEYDPTIFVWGRNDFLMLDSFYKLNEVEPIIPRSKYINLMQLLKNYYGLKNDVGLFNALSLFDDSFKEEQTHDALNDAEVTCMIYHYFKKETENE